jgi:thimet oligopeptidase
MLEQEAGSFYTWHEEVRLFKVVDEDGTGLGYFYLDLHPREGKYGHAAAFGLMDGKLLASGEYQRPVKAMVCNFARAQGSEPALIPHREVETLFHEFGHILHGILTTAKYVQFSGTSVAWDFVEAPSQILENWVWDYESLKRFARDWRKPSESIPEDLVKRMNAARKDGVTLHYLRQVSLARADFTIHSDRPPGDAIEKSNQVLSELFLPVPKGSAFAAGWGHMVGYAGGYYGYAWADVMAADLFSMFKKQGILNQELGRRLRREIYEPGGSRDENVSLERFLGRPLSPQAFFEDLGLRAG